MSKKKIKRKDTPIVSAKQPSLVALAFIRRWAPWLVGLAYLAIMLPIALTYHRVGNYRLETDFFWSYAPQARQLLQDGTLPIEDFRGPIYPILLAGVGFVTGDYFRAGILISVISASAILGMLYWAAARLWRPSVGLWAVALTAVNPIFVRYSYEAGTDLVFAALAFGTICFVIKEKGIPGGILGGIAYLTRFNGVSLIAASLFSRKRLWILAAFFVTITPWGIRCLVEKGDFFYNKNYLNLAYNVFSEGRVRYSDEFWWNEEMTRKFTSFASVVKADPVLFTKKILLNVVTHAQHDATDVIGIPQGILALIGVILLRPNRRQFQFLLFGILMYAVNLLAFYADRFSLFLIPFYSVLAVIGCEKLLGLLAKLFGFVHAETSGDSGTRAEPVH
jgi:hypothetical protein